MKNLKPQELWDYFFKICQIPRPTHYEEKIQEFIKAEAKNLGLEFFNDDFGNILIKKAPSAGREKEKTLALQAHLDMVGQKSSQSNHDFLKDPIKPKLSDGWVMAEETTLGADNGIGVAAALAILRDKKISHPPLEVLFTSSEEVGMRGAANLKKNWLNAQKLLNLDSESLGEICIGCAGGIDVKAVLKLDFEESKNSFFSLKIKGLAGGHSGIDIDKNRFNGLKIIADLMLSIADCSQVVQLRGGNLRNAICREAEVIFSSDALWADLRVRLKERLNQIKAKISEEDKNLKMEFSRQENYQKSQVLTADCSEKVLKTILDFPQGVFSLSEEFSVVETSNNLAIAEISGEELILSSLLRSLSEEGILKGAERLNNFMKNAGGSVFFSNPYPCWKPQNSKFLEEIKKAGIEAGISNIKVMTIHAGLECGLIFEKYPKMEMASIGPNIVNPHSPSEKVEVESVEKFWAWLLKILENKSDNF